MRTANRAMEFSLRNGVFLFFFSVLIGAPAPASATSFNLTFDASTNNAPAGFFTAFAAATQFYETTFSDPITINLQVGWGEINGNNLRPGNLGQSSTFQRGFFSYSQVKTALANDAKSPVDTTAVGSLATSDPTGGAPFVMSNAEAKALGLLAGNAAAVDGFVGFNSGAPYTFDPNNRAVADKFDFIGLASHEISEVMGRYGLGQNGASLGRYSPIDLFRYSSAGVLDIVPTNGAYFSIDGGSTAINSFNGTGGGDLSDWAGLTADSYNAFLASGKELDVTVGDIAEMDAIGYDPSGADVPESATLTFVGFSLITLLVAMGIRVKFAFWIKPNERSFRGQD